MSNQSMTTKLTRTKAIEVLCNHPFKFGHSVGFTLLTELHNKWIKEMVFGKDDKTLEIAMKLYQALGEAFTAYYEQNKGK